MTTVPELHQGIDDLDGARAAALVTASNANARAQAAELQSASDREQLAVAKREIDRLQAIIDSGPVDPPPTGTNVSYLGATVVVRNGRTYPQELADFEAKCGKVACLRTFNSGAPKTYSACNGAVEMRGRHRIISVKPGAVSFTAAYWDTFIASIPIGDLTAAGDLAITGLVVNHEPENDGGQMTPALYKARNKLMEERIAAAGRKDVVAMFVLMSWLERDTSTSTTSLAWFPDEPAKFVMLIDPYDDASNRTMQQIAEPTLKLWRDVHPAGAAAPWGIAETGSKRKGADLANWINTGLPWSHREGALFNLWFHSSIGIGAYLDDPAGQAAWKAHTPAIRS